MHRKLASSPTMLVACASAAVVAAGCGLPEGDYFGHVPDISGRNPRHLRWCNSGEPESMDLAYATTTTAAKLVFAMFDGLMVFNEHGASSLSLATRLDKSSDLRRFTLPLRETGKWSNGRTIDAYDIAYGVARIAHPLTASPNADGLETLKNQREYTGNIVRVVMRDTADLRAGELVDIVGVGNKTLEELSKDKSASVPNANQRTASRPLALRDLGSAEQDAYAQVPPGSTVTVIELSGRPASPPHPDGKTQWAYVHTERGAVGSGGAYGWVPAGELDGTPHAAVVYQVRRLPKKRIPGVDGTPEELSVDEKLPRPTLRAVGADLLMLPEALGVRVLDAHTVVFETTNPIPYFADLLALRSMRPTPREAVSRRPKRWAEPAASGHPGIVTSGPMTLELWKERDRLELVRSPSFWNPEEVKLDRLTAFSMDDQATAANFYATGGCDAVTANAIPSSYLPVLSGEKRGGPDRKYKDFTIAPWSGTYFAYINAKKVPNRHLRRALVMAIDRAPIPTITKGGENPSSALSPGTKISNLSDAELALCEVTREQPGVAMIMVPGELCYVPPLGLGYDPTKAKEELALAKKEMGASFPKTLTYRFNTGAESHKYIAEYLQSAWKRELGLDVTLESQEWKVYVDDLRKGNFEIARFGQIVLPDTEAQLLPTFRCDSPDNAPQWCNAEYEQVVSDAQTIMDRRERLKKVYEAERIFVEDAAILPMYVYTQKHLQRPYVKDLFINLIDQPPLHRAYLDPNWAQGKD